MTAPLTWNLHGNDQLSAILDKLDRTVGRLDHTMRGAAREARDYGRALGSSEVAGKRLQATTLETGRRVDVFKEKLMATSAWLRNIAITAGVALASAATAAGVFGIKLAAANETAAISFEIMLGSADKAMAFLKQLQEFAAATPFEMPQLRTAASRLLAVGTNVKDIIPLLTTLGDATAGMGTGAEGIERAVTALSQMRQKTKVSAEEMLQLTEAGIPAWEALASVLHTDVAHAMKMVSDRQVDAQKMFDAIETKAGAGLKRLTGLMNRQSQTLSGLWSTFKDNAGQALATFMEPAIPGLKRLLDFASRGIPAAFDKLRSAGRQIGSLFEGSDVPARLMASLDKLGKDLLPVLADSWQKITKTIADNREGLEKFGRFLTDIVIPIVGVAVITSINNLTLAFQGVIIVVAHVVDAIRFWTAMFLTNMKFILDSAVRAFGWIPGLGPKLKAAQREFDEFAAGVMDKLNALDGTTVRVKFVGVIQHEGDYQSFRAGERGTVQSRAGGGPNAPGWMRTHDAETWYATTWGTTRTTAQSTAPQRFEFEPLRVQILDPDGNVVRESLLALKRRRGLGSLGLA